MIDVAFKQDADGIYDLHVRFDRNVDPQALLASIQGFLRVVSAQPTEAAPEGPPTEPKDAPKPRTANKGAESVTFTGLRKLVLVQLHRYAQDHGHGPEQASDLAPYLVTDEEFNGLTAERTGQKIRYVLRTFRDGALVDTSGGAFRLTSEGARLAEQFMPEVAARESVANGNAGEGELDG